MSVESGPPPPETRGGSVKRVQCLQIKTSQKVGGSRCHTARPLQPSPFHTRATRLSLLLTLSLSFHVPLLTVNSSIAGSVGLQLARGSPDTHNSRGAAANTQRIPRGKLPARPHLHYNSYTNKHTLQNSSVITKIHSLNCTKHFLVSKMSSQ